MSLNITILEQSFERVKPNASEFSRIFYNNLLTDYPQLRRLFAKTDMEQQQQKLMTSLVLVVENLRNPNYLKTILKNLGERHISYGAVQEHYPMVGAALLKTFKSYFGTDWTPELQQAWTDAYEAVVSMMLEGITYPKVPSAENAIGQPDKQAQSSKAPTAPTSSCTNFSSEISKLENRSQSDFKQVQSTKTLTETTNNTSIINLKLLVLISVIAGLVGAGFLYYHYNSKQDNGSFTSSVAKTT